MMKNRPGEKIKLASLDELLGVVNEEYVLMIALCGVALIAFVGFKRRRLQK